MTPSPKNVLPESFYNRGEVTVIARELLGAVLCTSIDGILTKAVITETEAYAGRSDKACHAHNGRRTQRTEVMYGKPGHAYVYLCYGIHHLFNVVTNREGLADAVLIRGVRPLHGKTVMEQRRGMASGAGLTNGPGKCTQALGITIAHNKTDLFSPPVWIEKGEAVDPNRIQTTTRIGIDYAEEDALKPWRFLLP
ncbi:MAG: DNA-3-methyladenine glycosylase [Balneolaceae bacterium]